MWFVECICVMWKCVGIVGSILCVGSRNARNATALGSLSFWLGEFEAAFTVSVNQKYSPIVLTVYFCDLICGLNVKPWEGRVVMVFW